MRYFEDESGLAIMYAPNENAYIQQRQIVNFYGDTRYAPVTLQMDAQFGDGSGLSVDYSVRYDRAGNWGVDVDLTDILRSYNIGESLVINFTLDDEYSTHSVVFPPLPFVIAGLINPDFTMRPETDAIASLYDYNLEMQENGVILPPSRMYSSPLGEFGVLPVITAALSGLKGLSSTNFLAIGLGENSEDGVYPIDSDVLGFDEGLAINLVAVDDNDKILRQFATWRLTENVCGHRYVFLEWVHLNGQKVRHAFELLRHDVGATDAVSLITASDGFREMKGRTDSVVLGIDGLSNYDVWYYSSLVASPEITMYFKLLQYPDDDAPITIPVKIATNDFKIEAGADGTRRLEFTINYAKYDSITLQ